MAVLDLIAFILHIINAVIIPLIFGIAFLMFIIGVFRYFIAGAEDKDAHTKGRQFVIYGVIGFFLMIALWGIVNLIINTFGFQQQSRPPLPYFEGSSFGGGSFPGFGGNKAPGPSGAASMPANDCRRSNITCQAGTFCTYVSANNYQCRVDPNRP